MKAGRTLSVKGSFRSVEYPNLQMDFGDFRRNERLRREYTNEMTLWNLWTRSLKMREVCQGWKRSPQVPPPPANLCRLQNCCSCLEANKVYSNVQLWCAGRVWGERYGKAHNNTLSFLRIPHLFVPSCGAQPSGAAAGRGLVLNQT